MSLSCIRATDPNITNVHKLYDDASGSGHLWISNDAVPDCSSTSPPSPSKCVVWLQRGLYAACSNLPQTVKLVMERPGQHINTIESGKTCSISLFISIFTKLSCSYAFEQKSRDNISYRQKMYILVKCANTDMFKGFLAARAGL